VGVPQVVQPDHRQPLLSQRPAGLGDLAGEAAGEPLGVPVGAVEVAEHERRVAHEVQGQQSTRRSVGAQRGHGARVEVDDPGPAGLGRALDEALAGALGLDDADAAGDREAAASRSTSRQRRASASPRRIPVTASSRQPMASSGSCSSAQLRSRARSGAVQACISGGRPSDGLGVSTVAPQGVWLVPVLLCSDADCAACRAGWSITSLASLRRSRAVDSGGLGRAMEADSRAASR
jgi:hypothetical protein